jgi:hypothetical protein
MVVRQILAVKEDSYAVVGYGIYEGDKRIRRIPVPEPHVYRPLPKIDKGEC